MQIYNNNKNETECMVRNWSSSSSWFHKNYRELDKNERKKIVNIVYVDLKIFLFCEEQIRNLLKRKGGKFGWGLKPQLHFPATNPSQEVLLLQRWPDRWPEN